MDKKPGPITKALTAIMIVLFMPFVIALILVMRLIQVLCAPIEILIYSNSLFRYDLGVGYSLGITRSPAFKAYPYIKENPNLSLVILQKKAFYYESNGVILTHGPIAKYHYVNEKWYYAPGKATDDPELIEKFQAWIGEDVSDREIKFLVKRSHINPADLESAMNEPSFVLYGSKRDFATISA